ncbi:uncharacterized protein LOC116163874 [Photinus pyralis]|uniref:uncharacterized protein LOC116163874 n=1 Tax=Photinus pyralis TaxID=7054 RepID=UPI0012676E83|nr:uncharacterized protein LOC116163874 [Photinus pyralis]
MQMKVQELLDIDQDTDSDADNEDKVRRKPGVKSKLLMGISPGRGRPPKDSVPLKRRLHNLAKFMLDYVCEDGRKPMLAFMEKPSKKLYPDYYEVIAEPIDFLEIEGKIRAEQYSNESDLVKDFKLMFANCRQYNEENSTIYDDANLLERVLTEKIGQPIPVVVEKHERKTVPRIARPRKIQTPTEKNCRTLYETIRDYKEPKLNRQLSQIFMKLPSKLDYPDYYEVIKSPIDMEKISQRVKANYYETLDDLVNDFNVMFDNGCKYNEPDSQIYKDALILQRVCLQTKLQLKEDDDTVPDVPAAIQDLLLNLFTNVYNHQDAEERCYSDSMAELPEHDEVDGKKVRALSLDLIKRRLDKGLYRRLDTFQDDMFLVFCTDFNKAEEIIKCVLLICQSETEGVSKDTNNLTLCEIKKRWLKESQTVEYNVSKFAEAFDKSEDEEGIDIVHDLCDEIVDSFPEWVNVLRMNVAETLEDCGDHDNLHYLPSLVKPFCDLCTKLPLWTAIMQPYFQYGKLSASSASVESYFGELKNQLFTKGLSTVDQFLLTHIQLNEGSMIISSAKSSPLPMKMSTRSLSPNSEELHATENWKGKGSHKSKIKAVYLTPALNTTFKDNPKSFCKTIKCGFLKNGNSFDLKSIRVGGISYSVTNTCAFDSVVQGLATAYCDSEHFKTLFDEHTSDFNVIVKNVSHNKVNVVNEYKLTRRGSRGVVA